MLTMTVVFKMDGSETSSIFKQKKHFLHVLKKREKKIKKASVIYLRENAVDAEEGCTKGREETGPH